MKYLTCTLFILLFSQSCVENKILCIDGISKELGRIKIDNLSYKWSCGEKELILSKQQRDVFCEMLNKMKETEKKNLQIINWRVDIPFNNEETTFFKNHLRLCNHTENGYVFYKGNRYFKNDELAYHI